MRTVPEGIEMPDYAHAGKPVIAPQRKVFILDHESIQCMREAGKLGRKLLDLTASYIQVLTSNRPYLFMTICGESHYPMAGKCVCVCVIGFLQTCINQT